MSDAHSLAAAPRADVRPETRPETRPSGVPRREPETRRGPENPPPTRPRRSRLGLRITLMAFGALVLFIGAGWYWLSGGRYAETTDAYVQADVLSVSTDVSGIVAEIPVHEGQHVTTGQVLFRLDPSKFQIALDQAQANLAQTVLNLDALKADYLQSQRNVAGRQDQVAADQATFDRYAKLVKINAITPQQYDDAKYKLAADKSAIGSAQAQVQSAVARLGGKPDIATADMPAYKQAAASVAEAERQSRHAVVRAPYNGFVTQVSKLQIGQFLTAGTAAFGLVSTDDVWVEAEPKETNLTHARAGDPATVTIDAYPNHTWTGTVQSIAPATDQEFSVLPAQNSSGNWVKVVQRLPVRIAIDRNAGDPPLSAGMSAEVSVDTHHRRTLADLF